MFWDQRNNWRIERAVAVGIASVVAIDAAPALYVEILSNRRPMEQITSNDLTPTDTFLALGALSGLNTGRKKGGWRPPSGPWCLHHASTAGWFGTEQ
jgi:hypothetical protein